MSYVHLARANYENGIFSTAERSDRGEKYFLVTAVFSRVFFSQVSSHLINFFFTRTSSHVL